MAPAVRITRKAAGFCGHCLGRYLSGCIVLAAVAITALDMCSALP